MYIYPHTKIKPTAILRVEFPECRSFSNLWLSSSQGSACFWWWLSAVLRVEWESGMTVEKVRWEGHNWEAAVISGVDPTWLLNHKDLFLLKVWVETPYIYTFENAVLFAGRRLNMTFRGCCMLRWVVSPKVWKVCEALLVRCLNAGPGLCFCRCDAARCWYRSVCCVSGLDSLIAVKSFRLLQHFVLERGCN